MTRFLTALALAVAGGLVGTAAESDEANGYFDQLVASPHHFASTTFRSQAGIDQVTNRGPNRHWRYDAERDAACVTIGHDMNGTPNHHEMKAKIGVRSAPTGQDRWTFIWDYWWDPEFREVVNDTHARSDKALRRSKQFAIMASDTLEGGVNTWWKYDVNIPRGLDAPDAVSRWGICDGGYAGANITRNEPCGPHHNAGAFERAGVWNRVVIQHTERAPIEDRRSTVSVWRLDERGEPARKLYDELQYRTPWSEEMQQGFHSLRVMWSPKRNRLRHGKSDWPEYDMCVRNFVVLKNYPVDDEGTPVGVLVPPVSR